MRFWHFFSLKIFLEYNNTLLLFCFYIVFPYIGKKDRVTFSTNSKRLLNNNWFTDLHVFLESQFRLEVFFNFNFSAYFSLNKIMFLCLSSVDVALVSCKKTYRGVTERFTIEDFILQCIIICQNYMLHW